MLNRLLLGAEDADFILICLDDNCSEAELLNKFTQNSKSSTLILSGLEIFTFLYRDVRIRGKGD